MADQPHHQIDTRTAAQNTPQKQCLFRYAPCAVPRRDLVPQRHARTDHIDDQQIASYQFQTQIFHCFRIKFTCFTKFPPI